MSHSFNIVALARAVTGENAFDDWEARVEPMLEHAFNAKDVGVLLYGDADSPSLFELIDAVQQATTAPAALDQLLARPAVRRLVQRIGGETVVSEVLPYIVPVEGRELAPPGAGGRSAGDIGSYVDLPDLEIDGVSWRDPRQGALADCWLIASMIAIAWSRPNRWRKRLADTRRPSDFAFSSYVPPEARDGGAATSTVKLTAKVPVDRQQALLYAHGTNASEAWPALVEKAVAIDHGRLTREPGVRDYLALDHLEHPEDGMYRLLGGERHQLGVAAGSSLLQEVRDSVCRDGPIVTFPTVAQTKRTRTAHLKEHGMVADHAYAVLGVIDRGGMHVVLRNPFGTNPRGTGRAAGAPWNAPRVDKEPSIVELEQNGVLALDATAFDACFESFAWLVVPPDPLDYR